MHHQHWNKWIQSYLLKCALTAVNISTGQAADTLLAGVGASLLKRLIGISLIINPCFCFASSGLQAWEKTSATEPPESWQPPNLWVLAQKMVQIMTGRSQLQFKLWGGKKSKKWIQKSIKARVCVSHNMECVGMTN